MSSRGEALAETGITRAGAAAGRDWQDDAMLALRMFLTENPKPFLCEEVRAYASGYGLPDPPSTRAWGGVVRLASKAGLITHAGYRKVSNPAAHRTPASLWAAS